MEVVKIVRLSENVGKPGNYLLMHVIEKFSSSIFVNDVNVGIEWIYQMPMPMMKIYT